MLYLAIGQHSKQITVCVLIAEGDRVLSRQVSTRREKFKAFFEQLMAIDHEFMAIIEVCGFNDWLMEELRRWKCRETILIHPKNPAKRKTDRRDANKLADLLLRNRDRLAAGQSVHGLRRVYRLASKSRPTKLAGATQATC